MTCLHSKDGTSQMRIVESTEVDQRTPGPTINDVTCMVYVLFLNPSRVC